MTRQIACNMYWKSIAENVLTSSLVVKVSPLPNCKTFQAQASEDQQTWFKECISSFLKLFIK